MTTASIVLSTRNRAPFLAETLKHIARLRVPNGWEVELLVTDNGSTDETSAVIDAAPVRNFPKRRLTEQRVGQSNARNRGVSESTSEYIIFTDDDVVPHELWLTNMLTGMVERGLDVATGRFMPAPDRLRPWQDHMHRAWLASSDDTPQKEGVPVVIGGNMGVHRRVFDRIAGFDPELGPGALGFAEDTLFGWQAERAGLKIGYLADAFIEHHFDTSRLQRSYWLNDARKRGRSAAYVDHHWRHLSLPFRALRFIDHVARLMIRRLAQPPPPLQAEGCPSWEISYIYRVEYYRHFGIEQKRPRKYEPFGFRKSTWGV